MKAKTYITIFFLFCSVTGRSQDTISITYPVIGDSLPDFVLNDVHFSDQDQISLSNLKGKPFILDFFALGCPSCFKSLPKVNDLKKRFEGKVEFVLVGDDRARGELLRKAYEAHRKQYDLELTVAYDSVIFDQFKVRFVPTVIWVDKEGVVQAITTNTDLTKEKLEAFVQREPFTKTFDLSYDRLQKQQNKHMLDLIREPLEVSEENLIQKSVLGRSEAGTPYISANFIHQYLDLNLPFNLSGIPLENLYRGAYLGILINWLPEDKDYYGKYHYSPILEIADSTFFQIDSMGEKKKYSYSQFLPAKRRSLEKVMETMQQDLYSAFGYDVVIETREMPFLKLVVTDDEMRKQLNTKGGEKKMEYYFGGINYQNVAMEELVSIIVGLGSLVLKDLPLIDETGIRGNIDIKLDNVAMLEWKDVKRALQEQGLDMIMGKKEMQVLIIRDPKPINLEKVNQKSYF